MMRFMEIIWTCDQDQCEHFELNLIMEDLPAGPSEVSSVLMIRRNIPERVKNSPLERD